MRCPPVGGRPGYRGRMTWHEWLEVGVNNGWVSPVQCATHEGVPTTDDEDEQYDEGDDPCLPVLRVWPDKIEP